MKTLKLGARISICINKVSRCLELSVGIFYFHFETENFKTRIKMFHFNLDVPRQTTRTLLVFARKFIANEEIINSEILPLKVRLGLKFSIYLFLQFHEKMTHHSKNKYLQNQQVQLTNCTVFAIRPVTDLFIFSHLLETRQSRNFRGIFSRSDA